MLGIDDSEPVREEALRARFLSFDPLFDSASNLVAHQLVLRGRTATADAPPELQQMDEDMLLTGLYSLTQGNLTGTLPLLVQISSGVLFSDIPQQLNHRQLVWRINIDNEQHLARALALQDAGLTFCPALNRANRDVKEQRVRLALSGLRRQRHAAQRFRPPDRGRRAPCPHPGQLARARLVQGQLLLRRHPACRQFA